MEQQTYKNYYSLDIAKFLCAVLIISAHFAAERASFPRLIDNAFSLYIIAVPLFYLCSGFLFFNKLNSYQTDEQKFAYFKRYVMRLVVMYGLWTLVYSPFVVTEWIVEHKTWQHILAYFWRSLIFGSYSTIWFLLALLYAVVLAYFMTRKASAKAVFCVSLVLYVIGSMGYSYTFVQNYVPFLAKFYEMYNKIFISTRHGLLNGLTFVAMGAFLAERKTHFASRRKSLLLSLLLAAGFTGEAFVLQIFFKNQGADTVFLLVPFVYYFFQFLLSVDLKERKIYIVARKLSLLFFTSQRLFLSAIPQALPAIVMNTVCANSYVGLLTILLLTFAFSYAVLKASEKVVFLKKMM